VACGPAALKNKKYLNNNFPLFSKQYTKQNEKIKERIRTSLILMFALFIYFIEKIVE
jgi:hypothetical protein